LNIEKWTLLYCSTTVVGSRIRVVTRENTYIIFQSFKKQSVIEQKAEIKIIGNWCYRFSPLLLSDNCITLQPRQNIVTAVKNVVHDNRHKIRIYFSIEISDYIFSTYLIINYRLKCSFALLFWLKQILPSPPILKLKISPQFNVFRSFSPLF